MISFSNMNIHDAVAYAINVCGVVKVGSHVMCVVNM